MDCDKDDLNEIKPREEVDTPSYIRDLGSLVSADPLAADDVGDRCISLLGGRVIFGLLLGELADSFLVALASTLVSDGKEIDGKLLTATPVIRLFKGGVAFISTPEPEHRYLYYRHISRLTGVMPGFFTPERLTKIKETINAWSDREQLNRLNSSSDSAKGALANPGRLFPYVSTTRH